MRIDFPPLAPSAFWMSLFLKSISGGKSLHEAICETNSVVSGTRDFARFSLLDSQSSPLFLSVAVEGGAKQLKKPIGLELLQISEHGDWRKNHLGAMEACLGKKPFYRHLEPRFSEVWLNKRIGSLKEFNTAIFEVIATFILEDIKKEQLADFYKQKHFQERGVELVKDLDPSVSSLQWISTFGKESLLGFMALSIK